jgi:hypothetical protein
VKEHVERMTPVAAASSALATLACCLPLGGVGVAAISATLGSTIEWLRPWLLSLSVALLGLSFHQMYGSTRRCHRRRRTSIVLLWFSVVVVVAVVAFPDLLAGALADWLP